MKKIYFWFLLISFFAIAESATAACSVTLRDTAVCLDESGCATLKIVSVTGVPPFHYQWMAGGQTTDSITVCPFVQTTYTVIVVDSTNCTATASATVFLGPPPIPVILNPSVCKGSSIQLSQCFSWATVYSWSPSTGLSDPNICNPLCNDTANQTYVLTIWDVNGCSESGSLIVNVYPPPCPNGINELDDNSSFTIYPNPFSNSFTLTINGNGNDGDMVLHIYNVLGDEIRTVAIEKEQTVISRKEMADGIYFYRIARDGLAVHSGKLVIQ